MSEIEICISIIVPVYNVEDYIEECLDSVLQQNFENYELICVNDASTDNSGIILQRYAKQYSHIKVITHTENQGLSIARNTGLKNAKGKYIWFIDSDDLIVNNSLTELYNIANSYEIDILYFDMLRIHHKDEYKSINQIKKMHIKPTEIYTGKEFFIKVLDERTMYPTAWMQFIRRDFLIKEKIFFYNNILHEDVLFWFLCSMEAERVMSIDKVYYLYRQREGSIMDIKSYKRAESLFVILLQILTYWSSHSFTDEEHKKIGNYFENLYKTYQYYSCFGEKTKKLSVGGYVEKLLYEIIYPPNMPNFLLLNESQMNQIYKAKHIIVFGCGRAAQDIIKLLIQRHIHIDAIAVSEKKGNPEIFCGIKVDKIDFIDKDLKDAVVVIGVTKKYRLGISDKLLELGYNNIILPEEVK